MLWVTVAATFVLAIVVLLVVLGKRPINDLGSVSAHWIAEHRVDAP